MGNGFRNPCLPRGFVAQGCAGREPGAKHPVRGSGSGDVPGPICLDLLLDEVGRAFLEEFAMVAKHAASALALLVFLAGCASMDSKDLAGKSASARHQIDRNYIARVEAAADAVDVEVIWVNPPSRRADDNR